MEASSSISSSDRGDSSSDDRPWRTALGQSWPALLLTFAILCPVVWFANQRLSGFPPASTLATLKYRELSERPGDYDLVILGSSRAHFGVDPTEFAGAGRCFNLALPGSAMRMTRLAVEKFLESGNSARCMLLEVNPRSFDSSKLWRRPYHDAAAVGYETASRMQRELYGDDFRETARFQLETTPLWSRRAPPEWLFFGLDRRRAPTASGASSGATGSASASSGATGSASASSGATGSASASSGATGSASASSGATGFASASSGATGFASASSGATGFASASHVPLERKTLALPVPPGGIRPPDPTDDVSQYAAGHVPLKDRGPDAARLSNKTRKLTSRKNRVCPADVRALEEIVALLQARSTTVVLFETPVFRYRTVGEPYEQYVAEIRRIADKFGLQHLDFRTGVAISQTTADGSCFFDHTHLSKTGSRLFSRELYRDVEHALAAAARHDRAVKKTAAFEKQSDESAAMEAADRDSRTRR